MHTRSDKVVGCVDTKEPAAHVVSAVHARLPGVLAKLVPAVQSLHTSWF